MMNMKDDDVNLGVGMSLTKFGIRARVLSSSGAGVNAESRLDFPASDPLSELVWSAHDGLSLKPATSRAADTKPFLVWNVGPSSADGLKQSGDDAIVEQADDMIIEKETFLKADLDGFEEEGDDDQNCIVDQEANNSCKRLHRETGKEKALSDGDMYGRSWDEGGESCNSDGPSSKGMKGKKRQMDDGGVMLGSKRIKKQIHGTSSFLNWITNMTKVSPLTLACTTNKFHQGESTSTSKGEEESRECVVAVSHDVLQESDPLPLPLTSFWITRLSTKTPSSEKGKQMAEFDSRESADSNFLNAQASLEAKSISKLLPSKVFSSEAMASVFARRVDALRHITSSHVCFFCGDCHDVHECPNVTKRELEDLLLKLNTLERVEESSCLCIRCCRSDHWAISCPSATSRRSCLAGHLQVYDDSAGEDDKLDVAAADHTGIPACQTWKFEISSSRRVPASSYIATLQNAVAQTQMFRAIRNLRLTRADILRWMNSNASSSHLNGFYLRVRLGNLQAGGVLGTSSYHVACITGDAAQDSDACMSKKSISVDVGGIKSAVSTQYVSNHDFLEDEIKAWWWRTLDSGCRIPSLVELNSKLNHRKLLGF